MALVASDSPAGSLAWKQGDEADEQTTSTTLGGLLDLLGWLTLAFSLRSRIVAALVNSEKVSSVMQWEDGAENSFSARAIHESKDVARPARLKHKINVARND